MEFVERCRQLVERSPHPFAAVDGITHRLRYVNPALGRLLGRDELGLVGQPLGEVVPVDFLADCEDLINRVYLAGKSETVERVEQTQGYGVKDTAQGSYWSFLAWPMGENQEGTAAVMLQVTDTTEIEHFRRDTIAITEALLLTSIRQSEEVVSAEEINRLLTDELVSTKKSADDLRIGADRLRLLAETAPQKIFTALPNGSVDYLNPLWVSFTGLPVGSLQNWGWTQFLHPDEVDRIVNAWRESMLTARPFEQELRFRRSDGEYRWHISRAQPISDENGDILLWVGSSTDIHDQKVEGLDLERRIVQRTKLLEEANREMERFTYTVAHDLRAPLRAIVYSSRVLLEELNKDLSSDHEQLLHRQASNAVKLAALIDDLLKYSQLPRAPLDRSVLDFSQLAIDVSAELALTTPSYDRFVIQEGLSANADPQLLQFLMFNLMENAGKYSPDGGAITIGSTLVDGEIVYFVRDQGIGFDMAYIPKIFEPFERLVTEEDFEGTGIGLANVQRIVQRHGGRVWAESESGKGSTFLFTLGIENIPT